MFKSLTIKCQGWKCAITTVATECDRQRATTARLALRETVNGDPGLCWPGWH